MNRFRFDILACVLLTLGLLVGCYRPTNEDAFGVYVRTSGVETDIISLKPGFVFHQAIRYRDGRKWETDGWWSRSEYEIELHEGYDVYDFEHHTVIAPPKISSIVIFLNEGDRLISNESDPFPYKKMIK